MFEGISYEEILDRMMSRVSNKLDKREGSVIWDAHSPAALEIMALYIELERVLNESFGDTASREFLIRRCGERGITPYPASRAAARGEFTPKNVDIEGKRFNIGELNFIAAEKLAEGEYKMECEQEGSIRNHCLGRLTPIDYVSGLQTAELTELLIPGEDEEDTEKLRQRYFESFEEKAFGGNVKDYVSKTDAIAGVGQTKVTRVWNGDIKPSELIPSEETEKWYKGIADALPEEPKKWLDAVFKAAKEKKLTVGGTVLVTVLGSDFGEASEELVKKVQEELDPELCGGEGLGLAPIGHVVTVRSAEAVPVNISAKIAFETGYSLENLREALENAAEEYFSELRKGWESSSALVVRISQIETRLLAVKGVLDIGGTRLNGEEENLILGELQIPVLGGVEVD
ncbi:MAG: baseplate J/gp47 family protein [Bacteroides sp.]|nr:baseplate J/gp47 family protein [Bacteroides sp.]